MIPTDTITDTPDEDAERIRQRFPSAGMTQAVFAERYGIGTQARLWQFMNPSKKGGRPLNLVAAMRFAVGLRCNIGDISPSLQVTANEIAEFAYPTAPLSVQSPKPTYAAQHHPIAAATEEEKELLTGYRIAGKDVRRIMLHAARDALSVFEKRAEISN